MSFGNPEKRIHAALPEANIVRVPGTTHFLPMERPYVVRDAIDVVWRTVQGEFDEDATGLVRRTINDAIGVMN